MSIVHVHDEWSPLEEAIVGRIEGARIPTPDAGLMATEYPELTSPDDVPSGPFPPRVVEETAEDLAQLAEALEGLGVRVRRPERQDHGRRFRSLDWETEGFANLCPRDVLLPVGETIIETPLCLRARQYETLAYRPILMDYFEGGAGWIAAPRPRLLDSAYRSLGGERFMLAEDEPIFDAANVLRIGRDILYQVSCSGNHLGGRWLQRVLGPEYRVRVVDDLYDGTHLDSTLALVRPGLVFASAARVSRDNLPSIFRKWDVVYFDDIVDMGSVGHPISSVWLALNFMMVNPRLAVVDRRQGPLIRELERRGVDVVPLQIRHSRTLGGGFHCMCLDVRRRGGLESYCD